MLPDWPTFKAVWDAFYAALEYVDTVLGAAGGTYALKKGVIDRLKGRTQAASAVMDRKGSDWASRRGEPYAIERWLDERPWRPADLSEWLDCSRDAAEAILWAFGFDETDGGLWRRAPDGEARLAAATSNLGMVGEVGLADRKQLEEVVREQLRTYLDTGQVRPFDWQKLDWLKPRVQDRAVIRALTFRERVRNFFGR